MKFDLIDKKLDTFKKYQVAILRTVRKDYVVLSLIAMILGVFVLYFVTTEVHHKAISEPTMLALFCIFPGPIILAVVVSFVSYHRNKDKTVSVEAGSLIYKDKKYGHDSIWFIEFLGPYVMNIQMRGIAGFRFVSNDSNRNKLILEEIKKMKPDIQIKHHLMGKAI